MPERMDMRLAPPGSEAQSCRTLLHVLSNLTEG